MVSMFSGLGYGKTFINVDGLDGSLKNGLFTSKSIEWETSLGF